MRARRARRFVIATCLIAAGALPGVGGPLPAQSRDRLDEARKALSRGDVPRAVSLVDTYLRRDPADREAVGIKVEALASARDWESALDAYDVYVSAGGPHDAALLKHVGRAVLREAVAFFPALRMSALARLACGGDRDALLEVKRADTGLNDQDVEGLTWKARLGEFDALLRLRELAESGPFNVRATALQALQQLRDRGAERAIAAGLVEADPYLRMTAARAARTLRARKALLPLRALLDDTNPLVAVEAAAALAALGDARAVERLRGQAASPSVEIRFPALAGLLAAEQRPEHVEALRRIVQSRAPSVWPSAVELLADYDTAGAEAAVRSATTDPNAGIRLQAFRLLPRLGPIEAERLPEMRNAFRDLNTLVRIEAATAMIGTGLCP